MNRRQLFLGLFLLVLALGAVAQERPGWIESVAGGRAYDLPGADILFFRDGTFTWLERVDYLERLLEDRADPQPGERHQLPGSAPTNAQLYCATPAKAKRFCRGSSWCICDGLTP